MGSRCNFMRRFLLFLKSTRDKRDVTKLIVLETLAWGLQRGEMPMIASAVHDAFESLTRKRLVAARSIFKLAIRALGIFVCLCVCVFKYMYEHIYLKIHIPVCVYSYIYIHMYMYIYIYVYEYRY